MKKNKVLLIVFAIIAVIISCVTLPFLDDIVPTHIGITGEPDAFGSKYFLLIFPVFNVLTCVIMLLVEKFAKLSENYKKYMFLTGVIIQLVFIAVSVCFYIFVLSYTKKIPEFDITKAIMIIFGIMFIVLGNFMPKIEKNRTLGLKTSWSMYNENTWQKSHRFTGFASVIAGALTIILGLFLNGLANFIALIIITTIFITTITIASYHYYKQEKAKEQNGI